MTYTIKLRRGLSADWETVDPILAEGELGLERDTNLFKFGDGVLSWNDLPYAVTPSTGEGGGALMRKDFVATEGQSAFALDASGLDVVSVTVNGLDLDEVDWSLAGSTVTLDDPVPAGTGVVVFWNALASVEYPTFIEGPEGPTGPTGPTGPAGAAGINGTDATRGPVTINTQTGTSYTLVLADATKFMSMANAAATALTVPPNADVAFPIGTQIEGAQLGAGQVTLTAGSGVTINAVPGLKVAAQFGVFGLLKIDTNVWLAYGRLAA